jgi:cytidylate kinase
MPVVTVSRQFGSGGTRIAARVCELLGYRYLDKVLMTRVADEPELYRMLINIGRWSPEAAAQIILNAVSQLDAE